MWLDTLSTADRVNLLELYARSVMLLELGRANEWVELFEPSALLRSGSQHFKGRAELLELGRRMIAGEFDLAAGPLTPPVRSRHTLSDLSLFGQGTDGATGFAHLTVSSSGGGAGAPRWLVTGMYSDKLRRCGGGCWQFESRVLTLDVADSSVALPVSERAPSVALRA